jgi:hypothetical protein
MTNMKRKYTRGCVVALKVHLLDKITMHHAPINYSILIIYLGAYTNCLN